MALAQALAQHTAEYAWLYTWPFMLTCSGIYLLLAIIGKRAMRNPDSSSGVEYRKPFKGPVVKAVMTVYNITQIVLCSYVVYGLSPNVGLDYSVSPNIQLPNIFGINLPYSLSIQHFIMIHYFSKFLDYFDTFFIVIKCAWKRFSFLHLYHHSTIPLVWGFFLQNGHANGTAFFVAWINSLIHVLMYTHYLLALHGIRNPMKPLLTVFQIIQFYLCLGQSVVALVYETVFPAELAWVSFLYSLTMIALFTNYFMKENISKEKSSKDDKPKAD